MSCKANEELDRDFSHYDHDPGQEDIIRGHCVYRVPKEGHEGLKPVILLHELFGLSHACVDLARRLADDGFAVHLPLVFGNPLPTTFFGRSGNAFRMCISKEFALLRNHRTSPVTAWVRSLVEEVAGQHENSRVGVIGMCLTAHVVFPLTFDVRVGAVVACQSAIPWTWPVSTEARKKGLGISRADYARIEQAGPELASVAALRFQDDPISPSERMTTVECLFENRWTRSVVDPIPDRGFSPLKPHSILTEEYDNDEGTDTRAAYDEVVAFLTSNL